jgi:hypothetical protein
MLLKTTITFIFIFSFVRLGGNIFFFRFTPGLAFGEKDIGHPAITEYLSLTRQDKLRNRKIISERKQTFYGNSLPVRRTDKESIFVGLNLTDIWTVGTVQSET